MDAHTVVPILMLFTFFAVIGFAQWNKYKTEKQLDDPTDKPSSLAADGADKK